MFLQKIIEFFKDISLWRGVTAKVIGGIILAALGLLWWYFKRKPDTTAASDPVKIKMGRNSVPQTAVGDNVHQEVKIDKSRSPSGGVYIERVEPGATVNINVIDYQDGVSKAEKSEVREFFQKALAHYAKKEFEEAIKDFANCLELEEDSEKRGALNLQIGNCYYEQQMYTKAAEFYAAGLRESRKAKDSQGEASNLGSIANTYMLRPASSGAVRGDNVRKAVEHYNSALKIFKKDEYPVKYALIQNNLGTAYTDLPSATAEEKARNVRAAIDCYRAALEIYKKDEYPVECAATQNNLGNAYTNLPSATAEERAKNVRAAIDCYRAALEIRKKDEYPVEYAMTQNNLGNAYADLPAATAEERAKNVRAAIDCYRSALEIRKKDEYPQYYCQTAANLGLALASINNPDACYWLKEAYALREYLEDQGKRLEEVIRQICK